MNQQGKYIGSEKLKPSTISIITPLYNESGNLKILNKRLNAVLKTIDILE
jgi:hypothetical protein